MQVSLTVRDLVVVTWAVPPSAARRDVPASVELALTDDGDALVSLVAYRADDVRLGGRRVPGFRQLAVRTYARSGDEDGAFFLVQRVTLPGLGGIVFGTPVRPARIRVEDGRVRAPGLGASVLYRRLGRVADPPVAGGVPIGSQQVAFFVSAGLRRLPSAHEPYAWEAAELLEPPRVDPVLALGFKIAEPVSVLAARSAGFRLELPARHVR